MKTNTYNPETHVLVPREPSEEMCDAATADSCWENMNPPPSTAYRLMLAAAPQPEPVDVGSVGWKHDCAALCANDIELWIDRCPHCGKPRHNHPPADDELRQWISVDDRLPGEQGNDSEEILCFLNGHCNLTDMECRCGGGWGIRLGYYDAEKGMFRVFGRPNQFVTHWMPLPKPPAIDAAMLSQGEQK